MILIVSNRQRKKNIFLFQFKDNMLHGQIKYNAKNRYYYESLFNDFNESSNRIRINRLIKNFVPQ